MTAMNSPAPGSATGKKLGMNWEPVKKEFGFDF